MSKKQRKRPQEPQKHELFRIGNLEFEMLPFHGYWLFPALLFKDTEQMRSDEKTLEKWREFLEEDTTLDWVPAWPDREHALATLEEFKRRQQAQDLLDLL